MTISIRLDTLKQKIVHVLFDHKEPRARRARSLPNSAAGEDDVGPVLHMGMVSDHYHAVVTAIHALPLPWSAAAAATIPNHDQW